jgi:hypothetical protein
MIFLADGCVRNFLDFGDEELVTCLPTYRAMARYFEFLSQFYGFHLTHPRMFQALGPPQAGNPTIPVAIYSKPIHSCLKYRHQNTSRCFQMHLPVGHLTRRNRNGLGWKRSRLNRGTTKAFAWENRGKPRKPFTTDTKTEHLYITSLGRHRYTRMSAETSRPPNERYRSSTSPRPLLIKSQHGSHRKYTSSVVACLLLRESVYRAVAQKRSWYIRPFRGRCLETGLYATIFLIIKVKISVRSV